LGRIENNMFKWYEHVARKKDNRLPKRIITWSKVGKRSGKGDEIKKLTSDFAVNGQQWRLKPVSGEPSENWYTNVNIVDKVNYILCLGTVYGWTVRRPWSEEWNCYVKSCWMWMGDWHTQKY
jgi:hypothetical protein